MALIDKKILNPIRYHQDNANTVIGQASTMKALFDQGAEDLRVKLNGVIDELLATTGAQQIGIDPARGLGNTLADALTNIKAYMNLGASGISASTIGTGSGNTVQSQLEWLLLQIQDVLLNQIPDGTITMQKLATSLANTINGNTNSIGDLTTLDTTDKTSLVKAINEVNTQVETNNTQLAQIINYVTPFCSVYHNVNQSIAHAVLTTLSFNSERADTKGIHDLTNNNSRLICKESGKYLITANVIFSVSSSAATRSVSLKLNGNTVIANTNGTPPVAAVEVSLIVSTIIELNVNDYVEVLVFQATGSPLNINYTGDISPEFKMIKVG